MIKVIQQSRAEKMKMYMKVLKRKLCEMLINCNDILDRQSGVYVTDQKQDEALKPLHDKQIMPCPKCGCPSYGIYGYITKKYCPNCDRVWII